MSELDVKHFWNKCYYELAPYLFHRLGPKGENHISLVFSPNVVLFTASSFHLPREQPFSLLGSIFHQNITSKLNMLNFRSEKFRMRFYKGDKHRFRKSEWQRLQGSNYPLPRYSSWALPGRGRGSAIWLNIPITSKLNKINLILIQVHLPRLLKSNPVFFFFKKTHNISLTDLVFVNNSLSFLLHLHLKSSFK